MVYFSPGVGSIFEVRKFLLADERGDENRSGDIDNDFTARGP
jgi:hypothetical protein